MTTATGNFAELLWPGIREIWGNTYNDYKSLYTQVFETVTSDRAFEKYQGVTGLPLAGIKDQGDSIPYVDPFQGFQKEFVNQTFALGSQVTREMYEDDQYNYINGLPKMLARSARQTEETIAWNVINNAFNANFTGADGSILLVATHPLVGGGTYSNLLATASDLTQTSFEVMVQMIMDAVDDQQLKINLTPKTLCVPTAIAIRAEKILTSDLVSGSNDNDKNVVRGKCSLVVSPWLTDNDAWFITTDCPNGLIWQNRRPIAFDRDQHFDTETLKFKMSWRSQCSWVDPRSLYGTPGA